MRTDVHAHTAFSDGTELSAMIAAAEEAGLDGLGLTDHCIVTDDAFGRRAKYDLVESYERRREVIDAAREETDLRLYDAAEVSFVASETEVIRDFLRTADFDYTVGSVHFAGEYDYTSDAPYADADEAARRSVVKRYYDAVVALVDAELFDVLGRSLGRPHPDPAMLGVFAAHDVGFVLGTDSHRPAELTERVPELRAVVDDAAIELVEIDSVLA